MKKTTKRENVRERMKRKGKKNCITVQITAVSRKDLS